MFRPTQGGWAVPLSCENPALISWLGIINTWQQRACSVLGLECSTQPILELQDCNNKWSPLTIFGVIASVAVCLCLVVFAVFRGIGRWYRTRHGSLMVAAASAGAAAVRKKDPAHYPTAPHAYYRLADHELHAPLLCAACFERVEPNNLFQRGSCCEVCGIIAHEGCVKQAPEDCRPITLPADKILHCWKAAGTVMTDTPEEHHAEATVQHCLYCRQQCETDMFSVEPMWCCSSCSAVCHMRCYQDLHPDIPLANAAANQPNSQPEQHRSGDQRHQTNGHLHEHQHLRRHRSRSVEASPGRTTDLGPHMNEEHLNSSSSQSSLHQQPAHRKKQRRRRSLEGEGGAAAADRQGSSSPPASSQNELSPASSFGSTSKLFSGALRSEKRTSSFSAIMAALTSVVSGGHEAMADAAASSTPHHRIEEPINVEKLDICHLGHHRRLVLPPTSTRVLPSATWTSRAKSLLNPLTRRGKGKSKKGSKGSACSEEGKPASFDLAEVAAAAIDQARGPKAADKPDLAVQLASSGNQRRSTWWGPSELQWQDYRIEDVPARTKPLLVFVNTKSGPMLGHTLRRRFLRVLNPLQVVELPRESPEQALKLFAGLTNLRLLVIGGDGTVAWILSCLDALKAEMEDKEWVPPAMALLPLGTGNDLARCLNWGGGLGAFHSRGISAVLQDIEQSTVALLDRWDISIAAQPAPGRSSMSRDQLKRTASKLQGRKEEPAKPELKAMNNYLGIGVDAKAALEFHHLRTAYPNWFRSQIGNKLWYTGLGAKEIVQHSVKRISKRLQVVCDGEPLTLPDDIEGVLILNIHSYMGGVDLWASGFNSTSSMWTGKQSLCDGKLEVVGVYGSWHLGQLQVGLSKARRLCQCSSACITTLETLAMQIDGEPWQQAPAKLDIALKGQALMLKRLESEPLARMAHTVAEVLDHCVQSGTITASQRHAITTELAAKLHAE